MSDRYEPSLKTLLEAYLDGSLDAAAQAAFEERLRTDAELRRQVALQGRIDAALKTKFSDCQIPQDLLRTLQAEEAANSNLTTQKQNDPATIRSPSARHIFWWTAAALLLAAAGVLALRRSEPPKPHFEPRSIARIYQETVANGFEPYYECSENERFAATFKRRQGRPLWLKPYPPGFLMLGLSYPGGTSPDATGVLCRVDDEPVLVVVDRGSCGSPPIVGESAEGLNVFCEQRFGLVFYEATTHDEPRAIEVFSPTFADGVERAAMSTTD